MNKIPKQRMIYSNYDLSENYSDEDVIEQLTENGIEREDITDNMLWEERYFMDEVEWEEAKELLERVFGDDELIVFGAVGRWNGVFDGGFVCNGLDDILEHCTQDCNYIEFYDENGHLFLHCTHHDGSCLFEIKRLTEEGYNYYSNWNYNWEDQRPQSYICEQLARRYSRLFRIAEKQWGCPAREYEPITKENIMNHFAKEARSFYS